MISAPGVGFFKSTLSSERYYQSAQRLIRPLDLNRSHSWDRRADKVFPNWIRSEWNSFRQRALSFIVTFHYLGPMLWNCIVLGLTGWCTVGRSVASEPGGSGFEYTHRPFLFNLFLLFFFKWAIPYLFFFTFVFSIQLTIGKQMFYIKISQWLDSNRRSLVSEATTLPTGPQPLPNLFLLLTGEKTNI